ncbi:SDR family oxidoreductase [Streptomyces halobius]|uniref:3-dehydrosphinganine reductase n=1 Tax=Streptomyces halobius TaxID=2879846 RepID=A0ABY4LZI6_9ACTN|nr:SDR family oxidoreductase [Streptomyces halobius]UQA90602.1 SDR family oxidoreductase [Streptomyces halobius]
MKGNKAEATAGPIGPGTHAVVTGGSSGIGLATAKMLAARGARVSLMARTASRLDEAAAQLTRSGAQVATAAADVTDQGAVDEAVAQLTARQGPCDILVTSAGITEAGYFQELEDGAFRDVMETDYFGTLWPIRAIAPSMIERRRGTIIGVSAVVGMAGTFGYTAVSPAKFAVRGLLEAMRGELKPYGLHIGYMCPPDVDTPHYAYERPRLPIETKEFSKAMKLMPAEQVAAGILRLIERRKTRMVPGTVNRMGAAFSVIFPSALDWFVDRTVRKVHRDRPVGYVSAREVREP